MAQRLQNHLYIFKHSVSVYLSVKCTNVHISNLSKKISVKKKVEF